MWMIEKMSSEEWAELSKLAHKAAALRTHDAGIFDAVGALAEWYAKVPLTLKEQP